MCPNVQEARGGASGAGTCCHVFVSGRLFEFLTPPDALSAKAGSKQGCLGQTPVGLLLPPSCLSKVPPFPVLLPCWQDDCMMRSSGVHSKCCGLNDEQI